MRKLCCQICEGEIVFDSATKGGVCSRCGLSYSQQDLKSFGLQDRTPVASSAALAFPPPVTEPVYVSGSMMPSSHEVKAPPVMAASGEDARIGWWHTNIGASIGGALAICAINALPFLGDLAPWLAIVDCLLALALVTGTLVYALYAYPSYFGPKPKLTSAAKVSFLNCFFGGPLFGCLWNRCLTRGKKGVSHIVMSILAGVMMILGVLMLSFELNTSPEERMFDRIQEPGEMVDESTWVSDPMYPELIGDYPTMPSSYWEVFNDEACWVLSEVTGRPYDEVHQSGDAIYNSVHRVAGNIVRKKPAPQYCEWSSSHVRSYDHEFQVDGIRGRMTMIQIFTHETDERYRWHHKGMQTPWYVVVSVEGRI